MNILILPKKSYVYKNYDGIMMLSEGIINKELFAQIQDHPEHVLDMMEGFELSGIPVVEQQKFLGVLTKDTLLNLTEDHLDLSKMPLKLIYMPENAHILDAVIFFKINQVNFIPILDQKNHYLGFADPISVLEQLDSILVSANPGLILVLEMGMHDYSLAKVTHILESNQSKVWSSFAREVPENDHVELTLKISRENSSRAIQALQRHEYVIKHIFHALESNDDDEIMTRYQQLMNYINM